MQVKKLAIEKKVHFIGWVNHDDLPDFYRDADIFVLPSIIDLKGETETLGMVLVEAMSCGLPVIGSKVGGIPDVVTPDVGLLAEPGNSTDLADKLLELLADKDKRERMGKKAEVWAREHFSWQTVSQIYLDIYQEVTTILRHKQA